MLEATEEMSITIILDKLVYLLKMEDALWDTDTYTVMWHMAV